MSYALAGIKGLVLWSGRKWITLKVFQIYRSRILGQWAVGVVKLRHPFGSRAKVAHILSVQH